MIGLMIAIALGGFVAFQVTGSFKTMGENVPAASTMENAFQTVEDVGGTAFSLVTILVMVIIAAVIIGISLRSLGGAFYG